MEPCKLCQTNRSELTIFLVLTHFLGLFRLLKGSSTVPENRAVQPKTVAIIGAGPAGLIAAQNLSAQGYAVTVYERGKAPGRKFLLAGRGGLNLTHSEPLPHFLERYGTAKAFLEPHIMSFTPDDLRAWCHDLGIETFVGSSGRVFPKSLKASPLLRAWLRRLADQGVTFKPGSIWKGWSAEGELLINDEHIKCDAVLLALGGASWPELGSDGHWRDLLMAQNIKVTPFAPSNCGFHIGWSDHLRGKFSGAPLKSIALSHKDERIAGEIMIDAEGIEGGAVYALSAHIRDTIAAQGDAIVLLDLKPAMTIEDITAKLSAPRKRASFSTYLQKTLNLSPLAIAIVYEAARDAANLPPEKLAAHIKAIPLACTAPFPIRRAISSAGGISLDELTPDLMIEKMPGMFVAGEMLDWEARTGGYLLQACFATGAAAARGITRFLAR